MLRVGYDPIFKIALSLNSDFEIPSRVRRRTPIIPTFRKLRQEAHGFRTSLEHTELVQGQPGLIVKPQPETQTFELSVCAASSLPAVAGVWLSVQPALSVLCCRLLLGFVFVLLC